MTHFSQGIDLTVMPSPRMLNVDILRLSALAAMLLLAVQLTVMPPAGAPGLRPPVVAPVAALSRKLDGHLGAERAPGPPNKNPPFGGFLAT